MTDKQKRAEAQAVRADLEMAVDKYRPVWPMLLSTLIGWGLLALFVLPFCTVTFQGVTQEYNLFQLVFGTFEGGRANYWLGIFFAFLVLGPVVPLFSRRQKLASLFVGDVIEAVGIVGILVGFRAAVISRSFIGSVALMGVYDGLGFILPLVFLFLFLGVPFIARAISGHIASRRFDRSVKIGKKLANY